MWENTTPSTELPRDFCAGIGPLQLGVVLVLNSFIVVVIYPASLNAEKKGRALNASLSNPMIGVIIQVLSMTCPDMSRSHERLSFSSLL